MTPQPRKKFAQHWLRSDKALQQIIRAAELSKKSEGVGDRVLEIGPGTGLLTQQLLPLAPAVVAVEIDRDLCELLAKKLGKYDNFLLLQGDFLTLNLPELLVPFPNFQAINKVVANIPYNITGPIIEKLLGTIAHPVIPTYDLMVLLVQKEVAERLCAKPGSRAYGALSVRVQYLAESELIGIVPASAFQPPPKVDSAIVRLRPRPTHPAARDPKHLDSLVKMGFATKRKMLHNNLRSLGDRDQLTHLLEQLEINPQVRAEDLSISQWVVLSDYFTNQLELLP